MLVTTLHIKIEFTHTQDNDHLRATLRAYKFLSYSIDVPMVKVDKEDGSLQYEKQQNPSSKAQQSEPIDRNKITPTEIINRIQNMYDFLQKVVGLHIIVRIFLRKITVHKFVWNTWIGTGDAAFTGMLTGGVWSLKGNIVGLVGHFMKLKGEPELSVTPFFQQKTSQTKLLCMFSFRIGHAIGAVLRIVKYWKGHSVKLPSGSENPLQNNENPSINKGGESHG
jgi:hypothetical protein